MPEIVWTDYLKYRADLRGFDLKFLEEIVRFSSERYLDTETGRIIIVGHHCGTAPKGTRDDSLRDS